MPDGQTDQGKQEDFEAPREIPSEHVAADDPGPIDVGGLMKGFIPPPSGHGRGGASDDDPDDMK